MNPGLVYLDYQATTPLDPRVQDAVLPYLGDNFGNPHSINHAYGWLAADSVKVARGQVADFIGADDDEIVFTSGATESCNLAIRGVLKASRGERNKIITVSTEHPAVYETVLDLESEGYDITILSVQQDGLLDLEDLRHALDERTVLVSVMAANNEIGVLQPLADISELCHSKGAFFHTDATQAAGRIEVDVDAWGVDFLSISAHKVYGPKGIGALYARNGIPISPLLTGGGQENGLRPGTVPAPLVVGIGKACEIALESQENDMARMIQLTSKLWQGILKECGEVILFGHPELRLPGNLNFGFPGVSADEVIDLVSERIAISTGSACSSGSNEPSRILSALGIESEVAATGVRVSLGRFTCEEDIDIAIDSFARVGAITDRK